MKKQILTWVALVLGVTLLCAAGIIFTPSSAPAAPTIKWSPASITQTISAGESKTVPVSFTASENVKNVVVRVVPKLQPFVRTNPSSFPSITKGQTVSLSINISSPATSLPGKFDGTIQLVNGSSNNATVFANPLPVTLMIAWAEVTEPTTNISFALPPILADIATITGQQTADGSVVDVKLASTIDGVPTSQFAIGIHSNPSHLGLQSWFKQYVDPDGLLLASGVYLQQVLPGGLEALIQAQPLPTDDQVAPIFAISPSGLTIVTLSLSQVNDLSPYGYTTVSSWMSLLLTVLQTMGNLP